MGPPLHSTALRTWRLHRQVALSWVLSWVLSWALVGPPLVCFAPGSSPPPESTELIEPTEPGAAVAALLAEAGRENRAFEHVRELVTRSGPRLTGSANLERACDWALERFRAWGLEARLEPWGELPLGFDRGPSQGRWLAGVHGAELALVFTTPAWTPGTAGPRRAPALLEPRTQAELLALGTRLAGAWLVRRPRGERGTRQGRLAVAPELAAAGLAGTVRRATPRSSGDDRRVETGGRMPESTRPPIGPADVRLQGRQYDALVAALEAGQPEELEFDLVHGFRPGPLELSNVVAELPGTDWPDEVVIVAAHLDSWDGAQGAADDATGVASTLEAARLLSAAGVRPRRTLRFVLFTGEEQGLLGSRAWVAAHADELDRIQAVLVHDRGSNAITGVRVPSSHRAAFERAAALLGVGVPGPDAGFEVETLERVATRASSDHAPFAAAGVPAFAWEQAGPVDYAFVHHTQHDLLEHVDPEAQRRSARIVATIALALANQVERLDRAPFQPAQRRPPAQGRPPSKRRLGVVLAETEVAEVIDGGRAAEAGWRPGDRVLAVGGTPVETRLELLRALGSPGGSLSFRLLRAGGELESVLDWSRRPELLE